MLLSIFMMREAIDKVNDDLSEPREIRIEVRKGLSPVIALNFFLEGRPPLLQKLGGII